MVVMDGVTELIIKHLIAGIFTGEDTTWANPAQDPSVSTLLTT